VGPPGRVLVIDVTEVASGSGPEGRRMVGWRQPGRRSRMSSPVMTRRTQVPALDSTSSVAAIMNRRSSASAALAPSVFCRCAFASASEMTLMNCRTEK
jgi:hypothetical protein